MLWQRLSLPALFRMGGPSSDGSYLPMRHQIPRFSLMAKSGNRNEVGPTSIPEVATAFTVPSSFAPRLPIP